MIRTLSRKYVRYRACKAIVLLRFLEITPLNQSTFAQWHSSEAFPRSHNIQISGFLADSLFEALHERHSIELKRLSKPTASIPPKQIAKITE